jgi:hypothetical protein
MNTIDVDDNACAGKIWWRRTRDSLRGEASRLAIALAAVVLTALPAQAANVQAINVSTSSSSGSSVLVNGVRPQDEIMLVNVRGLGGRCDAAMMADRVRVESYQITDESSGRRWETADVELLRAADPSTATLIFVHGNKITPGYAKREGLSVYRRIVRQSTADTPIRFVVFSWPSSQASGPLRDVRIKAGRTNAAGCQLAWLVDQLPAETPVSMVGYSFGARIVTGALHVLGGGTLAGRSLPELQQADRPPMNAVLISAATNADWLCSGHCHGEAMALVGEMSLLNNRQDRAMQYYHLSTTHGHPQGMGLCGPTCIEPEWASKITNRDLGRYVGSSHELFCYLSAPGVASDIWASASRGQ